MCDLSSLQVGCAINILPAECWAANKLLYDETVLLVVWRKDTVLPVSTRVSTRAPLTGPGSRGLGAKEQEMPSPAPQFI